MRNIEASVINLDNTTIRTFSTEICDACNLDVEAGTTGFKGGDSGHGCRTYIRLTPLLGADIDAIKQENGTIEIIGAGDAELRVLLEAFKFIIQELEDEIEGKNF